MTCWSEIWCHISFKKLLWYKCNVDILYIVVLYFINLINIVTVFNSFNLQEKKTSFFIFIGKCIRALFTNKKEIDICISLNEDECSSDSWQYPN